MSYVTIEQVSVALGVTASAIKYRAKRESWPYETESCRGGQRRLYAIDSLPLKVQAAINVHLAIEKAKEHTGEDHGNHERRAPGGELEAQRGRQVGPASDVAGVLGAGAVPPATTFKTQLPERVSFNGNSPAETFVMTAPSGEPTQAGLPSPANSSPAATVAGGLPPAGGDFFAAGLAAGLAVDENKAETMKRVKEAERRLRIIKPILDWTGAGKSDFVMAQAQAHDESKATLYRWIKRYQQGGFPALMDKPRADKHQARVVICSDWETAARGCGILLEKQLEIAQEVTLVVRGLWAQQGQSSARQVALLAYPVLHKLSVAAGMPEFVADKACKLLGARRFINGERRFSVVATASRDGKGHYDRHQTSIKRSRAMLKPGDVVFGDVSPSDIPVTRPDGTLGWARLIAWQDAATNMLHITGFLSNPGSSVRREHVALAFAKMCEDAPWGMPRRLYLDNGSEYSWIEMIDAWRDLAVFSAGAFGGAWGDDALGEEGRVFRSIPFKPRAKSLEGQFSNLLRFFGWHKSFSGSDRMRKKVATLGKGVTATSLDDLKEFIGQSLAFYHGVPQGGHLEGMSPAEKMAEFQNLGYVRTVVNSEALALAFSDRSERKVRAGQVEAGGWHYYHPKLHEFDGETVQVRWPRHAPDAAYVFRKGQLLCVALPAPVFAFADPAGAKHAGRLATEARQAVGVMKGQVAWLDPRDLMGEFAKLARVDRVIDAASRNERRIALSADAQAMVEAKHAAVMALVEAAANQKVHILDRRFDHSDDPEVEAARALGY